ncbi:SDR family oxidoreductase [Alphaproteobacteria bacterium]|nr:SDR family oxidoreductase [Alphaproteobacteria bacterium]
MLDGLNIAIVGGGAGLGATVARLARERGAGELAIIDLDLTAANSVAQEISGVAIQTDIRTKDHCQQAFGEAVARLGRVHSLVNCAAVYPRKSIFEINDEDWDLENAVNVKGTYHMMVAAVYHMRQFVKPPEITGRIVNITSVDAFKAHPQNAHYAATKAAVVSLTKSFAHECAADQILVNSIAPAGMATEKAAAAGFLPELAKASPLGRGATPEEIAEFVLMAASNRNTYMTGENQIISGGYIYA